MPNRNDMYKNLSSKRTEGHASSVTHDKKKQKSSRNTHPDSSKDTKHGDSKSQPGKVSTVHPAQAKLQNVPRENQGEANAAGARQTPFFNPGDPEDLGLKYKAGFSTTYSCSSPSYASVTRHGTGQVFGNHSPNVESSTASSYTPRNYQDVTETRNYTTRMGDNAWEELQQSWSFTGQMDRGSGQYYQTPHKEVADHRRIHATPKDDLGPRSTNQQFTKHTGSNSKTNIKTSGQDPLSHWDKKSLGHGSARSSETWNRYDAPVLPIQKSIREIKAQNLETNHQPDMPQVHKTTINPQTRRDHDRPNPKRDPQQKAEPNKKTKKENTQTTTKEKAGKPNVYCLTEEIFNDILSRSRSKQIKEFSNSHGQQDPEPMEVDEPEMSPKLKMEVLGNPSFDPFQNSNTQGQSDGMRDAEQLTEYDVNFLQGIAKVYRRRPFRVETEQGNHFGTTKPDETFGGYTSGTNEVRSQNHSWGGSGQMPEVKLDAKLYHGGPGHSHNSSYRQHDAFFKGLGQTMHEDKDFHENKKPRHRSSNSATSYNTSESGHGQDTPGQDTPSDHQAREQSQLEYRGSHEYKDKLSFFRDYCRTEHGSEPTVYQARLRETFKDRKHKIRKLEFGKENKATTEKVIMLVGATGSGKSTMINAIFNYLFGIAWQDEYRLKLIPDETKPGQQVNQAISQTSMITAYTIHYQQWFTVPYTLTIIDTPGFGDTGGLKRDKEIMEQIRNFFKKEGSSGIDHLDVVGFVTQSSLPRLAPVQRYVFDSILSIFGKNIAENIFMLLTFADGQKPQVLSGLKEANMTYQNCYKFNNSALYVAKAKEEDADDSDDEEDEDDDFDEMFWKMGANNFKKFMTDLEAVQAQSLVLTAEVLEERYVLEVTVSAINENIKRGLKKLEQLKMEQELLKHHQSDIDKNRDFTYETEELEIKSLDLKPGKFATNCMNCYRTCHKKCKHYVNYCTVIGFWGETCLICRCHKSMHERQPFCYVWEPVKVIKTSKELKRRYEEAEGKKLSAKQLIERCSAEFVEVQAETLGLTERARECLTRLNEIALKPNPLSTTDYIDLMIQEEEFMAGPGWKETVHQLEEVKKRANNMKSLTDEGFDPFAGYQGNEEQLGN